MADVLNAQVVDGVTSTNFKTIAEANSLAMNLAVQNSVNHQLHMQSIAEASVGKIIKGLVETDIAESGGLASILQQLVKTAQTTPPQTG